MRKQYPGEDRHAIFLFDSLDRLPDPDRFREAVEDDLRVLKTAGIGVAVVGPIRFMAGTDRAVTLPPEPDIAEWLVLIGRGDLIRG